MSPVKNSAWEFETAEEFEKKILQKVYLRPEVPLTIRNSVKEIEKMLLFSFYESFFVEDAYTKAVIVFERSLRIRCKEIANGKEDIKFYKLINWFFNNNYFETENLRSIHKLREIRNSKAHDIDPEKGGLIFLVTIYAIFDLINDLYEDIALRIERRQKRQEVSSKVNDICKDGFVIELQEKPYLGHKTDVLFYNNKITPSQLVLSVNRCMQSELAQVGADRNTFSIYDMNISEDHISGKLKEDDSICTIRKFRNADEKERFLNWKTKYGIWEIVNFDSVRKVEYEKQLRLFYQLQSI